jgi:hypothetical protein
LNGSRQWHNNKNFYKLATTEIEQFTLGAACAFLCPLKTPQLDGTSSAAFSRNVAPQLQFFSVRNFFQEMLVLVRN